MESRLRVRLVDGGVEELDVQYDVYDDDGHVGRADLHVKGVLVEDDGREQRLERTRFTSDRQRQNRLSDTGSEIRRFTATDAYHTSAAGLGAEVRRAVAIAATRKVTLDVDRAGRAGGQRVARDSRVLATARAASAPFLRKCSV